MATPPHLWSLKRFAGPSLLPSSHVGARLKLEPTLSVSDIALLKALLNGRDLVTGHTQHATTSCSIQVLVRLKNVYDAMKPKFAATRDRPSTSVQQGPGFQEYQNFLVASLIAMRGKKNISLHDVISVVQGNGLVSQSEDCVVSAIQLLFISIGFLSGLYDPVMQPDPDTLMIRNREDDTSMPSRADIWQITRLTVTEAHGSVPDLLRLFAGGRAPIPLHKWSATRHYAQPSDHLYSRNLSFYTIHLLGQLELEWTNSLCMHLTLDRRKKRLLVFTNASLCAFMAMTIESGSWLDSTFAGYLCEERTDPELTTYLHKAGNLYKEVLLSYRVLFGQHKASWQLFRKHYMKSADREDLLLSRFCGADWAEEEIYDDIDAPPVKSIYTAGSDFPFLGEKLIALHQYVELLSPHDWRMLWYDRRDLVRFWTVWAVIIFGLSATLLAIFGVLLAAAQVAGTFKPSQQD